MTPVRFLVVLIVLLIKFDQTIDCKIISGELDTQEVIACRNRDEIRI